MVMDVVRRRRSVRRSSRAVTLLHVAAAEAEREGAVDRQTLKWRARGAGARHFEINGGKQEFHIVTSPRLDIVFDILWSTMISGIATQSLCLQLILVLLIVSSSNSFILSSTGDRIASTSFSHQSLSAVARDDSSDDHRQHRDIRFTVAASTFAIPLLFSLDTITITDQTPAPLFSTFHPPAAQAIQAKNEALCNTGFFTNVGAWYCTDIGNIGDEGKPKPMSEDAESSVNSLMSKFNIDGETIVVDDDTPGKNGGRGSEDRRQTLDKRQANKNYDAIDQ